jgi:hypothetical protein
MGEAGSGEGVGFGCHSGALVKRANPESRGSGFALRAPRNDGEGPSTHGWNGEIRTRRKPGTPLSSKNRAKWPPSLDFRGLAAINAQPLGSPSRQMRNIITKLLIVVVPRRTAGDG